MSQYIYDKGKWVFSPDTDNTTRPFNVSFVVRVPAIEPQSRNDVYGFRGRNFLKKILKDLSLSQGSGENICSAHQNI